MKAAIVRDAGQLPAYDEFAEPVPSSGEALVTVTAAAVSHVVKSRASGTHYSSSGQFPFVVGIDGVGRLEDGTRVYFMLPRAPHGSMAERTVMSAARCLPLPDDLDDVTAAAIANPGMSSWAAYTERARLKAGETVLINGATGTSGRLAVQIAKQLGATKIIAVGRDADSLRAVAALGADVTIQLVGEETALEQRFESHFADGVDVVLDYLWGRSAECLLRAAAHAAPKTTPLRFVQVGSASGSDITLSSDVLRSSTIAMMGSGLGSVSIDRFLACIAALMKAAGPGGFEIACKAVPLAELEQAWAVDDSTRRTVFTMA